MPEIVGVRLKKAGKLSYFDTAGIVLKVGDKVVVETARGIELGIVVASPKAVNEVDKPLKPVLRLASAEDLNQAASLAGREQEVLVRCREAVARLELPMKLIGAEYNLDATRLTVYFCAQGRVDFRELVRYLAGTLKTRVELRQVGPRDEAKLCGHHGRCGRPLCCGNFITEFTPVSIKMAKEQDLPLNPPKISGLCGRLLCCLAYEYGFYHSMKENLPKVGKQVNTPMGPAKLFWVNVLKQTALVQFESQAIAEFPLNQIDTEVKAAPKQPSRAEKAAGSPKGKSAPVKNNLARPGPKGQELKPV